MRIRWLVAMAWLCGCGGDDADSGAGASGFAFDAGDDPDRNKVEAGDICDRVAHIQCAGEEHCCREPGRDFTECKAEMRDACKTKLFLDKISGDPVVAFDEGRAEAVFQEFEALAEACDPSIAEWGASRNGLVGLFEGSVGEGDACTPADGLNASASEAGAALASCENGATVACMPDLVEWTCVKRVGDGGACFLDTNCKVGLYCDNPDMGLDGVCVPRKADGEACDTANQCDSLFCKGDKCVAPDDQVAFCLAE